MRLLPSISDASCGATGASSSTTRVTPRIARRSPVRRSARLPATWSSRSTSSGAEATASLKSAPRPASAGPASLSVRCVAVRVSWSNVLMTWSSSTVSRARASGSWPPCPIARPRVPSLSSRYLSPSGDRGRTVTCESSCSGSSVLSSFRVSLAYGPFAPIWPRIVSIEPTRLPPTRTSLPSTRPTASGTETVTW